MKIDLNLINHYDYQSSKGNSLQDTMTREPIPKSNPTFGVKFSSDNFNLINRLFKNIKLGIRIIGSKIEEGVFPYKLVNETTTQTPSGTETKQIFENRLGHQRIEISGEHTVTEDEMQKIIENSNRDILYKAKNN